MLSTKIIAFLTAVADFVFGGFLSNGFIITVIINEWVRSRSLPACEQLLLSLGVSNICTTVLLILNFFTIYIIPTTSNYLMLQLYYSLSIYVVFLRYWLTAWLCVFYCIKILNSTHSLFLWWKMRISRLVSWLIVGSCVISFLISLFIVLSYFRKSQNNGTTNITITTEEGIPEGLKKGSKSYILIIGSSCPLLVVFLCSILVVTYLCRHVGQITSKGSNVRSLQTEAHIKAAWIVLSLLFLYISYYVAQTVSVILEFPQKTLFLQSIGLFTVMLLYSPVQAAILVLSNPKLKQKASQMFLRPKS